MLAFRKRPPVSSMSIATSLLLGALIGLANAAVALVVAHFGRTMDLNPAMALVLGGGFARLAVLLGAVVLVLALTPVDRLAFVGGLGAVFVLGLVAEIALVLGRPGLSRPPADA